MRASIEAVEAYPGIHLPPKTLFSEVELTYPPGHIANEAAASRLVATTREAVEFREFTEGMSADQHYNFKTPEGNSFKLAVPNQDIPPTILGDLEETDVALAVVRDYKLAEKRKLKGLALGKYVLAETMYVTPHQRVMIERRVTGRTLLGGEPIDYRATAPARTLQVEKVRTGIRLALVSLRERHAASDQ